VGLLLSTSKVIPQQGLMMMMTKWDFISRRVQAIRNRADKHLKESSGYVKKTE
jgi:hypothetical protein